MQKSLRGINLGGWLILERWITPSIFADSDARDEWTLCRDLGESLSFERLKQHRESFITHDDIKWISEHGFDAVRLPVGYWILEDCDGFYGGIQYVDKLFSWAQEFGLKVLLDLHGLPGSQNGGDHSGRIGRTGWYADKENIIKSLVVLRQLAKQYSDHPSLYGLEVINEPHWDTPTDILIGYYQEAHKAIRELCDPQVKIVVSDGFRPTEVYGALKQLSLTDVVIDTHLYQVYTDEDKALTYKGRLRKIEKWRHELAMIGRDIPVIVGEWSAALDPLAFIGMGQKEKTELYKAYYDAQYEMYHQTAAGSFYWTYKTEDKGPWSYRDQLTFH